MTRPIAVAYTPAAALAPISIPLAAAFYRREAVFGAARSC